MKLTPIAPNPLQLDLIPFYTNHGWALKWHDLDDYSYQGIAKKNDALNTGLRMAKRDHALLMVHNYSGKLERVIDCTKDSLDGVAMLVIA